MAEEAGPEPMQEDEVAEAESLSENEVGDEPADNSPDARLGRALKYKEAGNTRWQAGKLEMALKKWRKGIDALDGLNHENTGDPQVQTLLVSLHSNVAMALGKSKQFRDAIKSASVALEIDPNNTKCLFRRGCAFRHTGDVQAAKADLTKVLKLDPKQASAKKQLLAMRQEAEQAKKRFAGFLNTASLYGDKAAEEAEREEKRKVDEATRKLKEEEDKRQAAMLAEAQLKARRERWENECVSLMANNEPVLSFDEWNEAEVEREREEQKLRDQEEADRKAREKEEKERERAARAAASAVEVVEDEEELEGLNLRGYKMTSDGRRTSYFHNELDDHTKTLIGDIAPKRLNDPPPAAPHPSSAPSPAPSASSAASSSSSSSAVGAAEGAGSAGAGPAGAVNVSAWNAAGTWQERDMTAWAKDCLQAKLAACSVELAGGMAEVDKVSGLEGDAHVAYVRGKVMFIFEFSFKAEVCLTVYDEPVRVLKASLDFVEVNGDCGGEYDATLSVDNAVANKDRPLVHQWVGSTTQGLRPQLVCAINAFVAEFRALNPSL